MANLTQNDFDIINDILESGGTHTIQVEVTDIDSTGSTAFENFDDIKHKLYDGFTVPPSSIINDPKVAAAIVLYGDDWTNINVAVHTRGGEIKYKKIDEKTYDATITI